VEHKARSFHSRETTQLASATCSVDWTSNAARLSALMVEVHRRDSRAGSHESWPFLLLEGISMKRMFITIVLTAFLLLMLPTVALAQGEPSQVPVGDLFSWFTQDPPNYRDGLLFLVLGALGALATMYTAVGGVMPGTAGKEELDRRQRDLEVARQLANGYQQQVEALNKQAALTQADLDRLNRYREDLKEAQNRGDKLESKLSREKWTQFGIACVFYLPLGGGFAAALAQDLVQALIIGAGWPTLWGSYRLTNQVTRLNQEIAGTKRDLEVTENENALLRAQVGP
jgi:hypothetical protein